jgi:hypothetical protein
MRTTENSIAKDKVSRFSHYTSPLPENPDGTILSSKATFRCDASAPSMRQGKAGTEAISLLVFLQGMMSDHRKIGRINQGNGFRMGKNREPGDHPVCLSNDLDKGQIIYYQGWVF